jgi:uncharacterized membrane protein
MPKRDSQIVKVGVGPKEVTLEAKGVLAIKLGFVGVFTVAHLIYSYWWLGIGAVPALFIYLLSVALFVIVFAFCWSKTFSRTTTRRRTSRAD